MSDPRTFGQAVREARLAKGMSMGQLATSVERSTASVRRWERDEGVPAKSIIEDLAAVLGLTDDELALIEREPVRGETPPHPPEVTPTLLTPPEATPAPATPPPTPPEVTPAPAPPLPPAGQASGPSRATPAPSTPAPSTPAPSTPAPSTPGPWTPSPASGPSQATQAAGNRVTGVAPAAEPVPTGVRGWFAALYDSENPWLGYFRAALTVAVMIVLAWVLVWALAELFDAVGEIWDGMWADDV